MWADVHSIRRHQSQISALPSRSNLALVFRKEGTAKKVCAKMGF